MKLNCNVQCYYTVITQRSETNSEKEMQANAKNVSTRELRGAANADEFRMLHTVHAHIYACTVEMEI